MSTADPSETIAAVRRACLAADESDPLDEAAALRLQHDGLDALPHWVDDAGFALVRGEELDLAVHPDLRERGHGGRLLRRAVARPGKVLAWSHGDHPAAAALAASHGFQRVRELWVMRRPTSRPLAPAPAPDGVRIRAFDPARDVDALLAVNAAAFADHPEQGDLDRAGMQERMDEPWFDAADLLLAESDEGELLGFHWTKRHDADHREVYVVGVSPAAQGRGLGRVLTVAGLEHMARAGASEVLLHVEADNEPATALYADLGFTRSRRDTHVQYLRP